jgi:hypothetical protein
MMKNYSFKQGLLVLTGLSTLGINSALGADYSAVLGVSPKSYTGKCPKKFYFKGKITAKKKGRVQYKFIRSDGAFAPIKTIHFSSPGSRTVNTTWTLGGPNFPVKVRWQAIQIVYPTSLTSNKANFRLRCRKKPFRPKVVRTRTLRMTGMRFRPKVVKTRTLTMTGVRFKPKVVKTRTMTMTGVRKKVEIRKLNRAPKPIKKPQPR